MDTVRVKEGEVLVLGPEDYAVLDEDDFGAPGLVAAEVVGPFVRLQAVGPLIMVHDAVFDPHRGIGHHPHRFNERLFYILEGAVDHDDALNDIQGHMGTGDVGRLTEGQRGMLHKEWNDTPGRARAFILVYRTDPVPPRASFAVLRDGEAPRYPEAPGVETKELVGPRSPLRVHGDLRWFGDSRMEEGAGIEQELGSSEAALLFALEGTVEFGGGPSLGPGQAAVVGPGDGRIAVSAREGARLLRAVVGAGQGLVFGEPWARR
ncbi:MAG TPA: pirin family protein [Actinomycetota bacterium]|nr:pirin family protein [Actinomycetota bacterium]